MSSFRPRKPYRFSPRVQSRPRPARLSVRVCSRVRITGVTADHATRLLQNALTFALTTAVGAGLIALSCAARAQDPLAAYTHDVALHFQTDDLAHPNGGANGGKLASMWGPNLPGGFSYTYNLTTGWNANTTFGSFTDFKIPAIDLGALGTIPALDLGEWGAGGQLFTKGQNTGLVFQALASAGGVSVDYPMHVTISTPKFVRAGYPVKVHVTYTGDAAAKVSTYSPQAAATMSFNANVQLFAKGRLELAGYDLFNSTLIDACSRTDRDSPLYGQGGNDKSLAANITLIDTNTLINKGLSKATIKIGPDPASPEATIGFNLPIVNTVGQPGSSANYQSGAGGTGSVGHGASYEYTTGITTPAEVLNNPNATYARGQDSLLTVAADFTNILTTQLEESGIPVPPLNYSADLGKGVTLHAGLLDFTGSLSLGFLQEFGFVPRPQISLTIDGVGTTTPIEVDPINGTDITFQMPGDPNAASNPAVPLSVRCTPHITLGNDFISNTYFNLSGSLGLDAITLSTDSINLGKGVRIPSFSFDPFPLTVGASVPVPLYKTTFEIPFSAQDGDSFYVQTNTPPLASLLKLDPNLLYVNERDTINTGVSSLGTTLYASTTILPGNDFAAPWYGTVYPNTASQLHYGLKAYWDQVVASNQLFLDGFTTDPATGLVYQEYMALFYNATSSRPDLSPGIHHIYASNFATTTSAPFGPLVTSLPISVAYPLPHIDDIGFISTAFPNTSQPQQDLSDPFRYSTYYHYEANQTVRGKVFAGDPGYTIVAVDNTAFNPPNSTLDPNVGYLPFAEGSYSRIKFNGKLLAPDPAFNDKGRSWVTGIVPASMIATPGLKTIQITNPTTAGQGGDSNPLYLRVRNPQPAVTDVTVVQQGAVGANNKAAITLNAHQITAGATDTQVSITGSALNADTSVYFNDPAQAQPLKTKFVDSTLMYATIPATALTVPLQTPALTLVNAGSGVSEFADGGTVTSAALHIVANTPKITDVQANGTSINALPLDTPADTKLTIKGVYFWPGVTATFGGTTLPTTFVDTQTLIASVPAAALSDRQQKPDQVPLLVSGTDYDGNKQRSNPFGIQALYAKPVLRGTNALNAATPPAMQVGTAAPTVTVTGGLFYTNSKVTLNGVACASKMADSTHLSVTIPPAVANTTGNYLLVVTNPTSNDTDGKPLNDGGPSNAVPFQVLQYAPQAQLGVTATLTRLNSTTVQASFVLTNTGAADAANTLVTTGTLGSAAATVGLPLSVGTLAVGQTSGGKVNLSIPASAKGTIQTLKLSGTMTTSGQSATFSTNARVQIP